MSAGKLFWNKICPFVQRSWIAAVEKSVDIELVYVDLKEMPKWYTEINPRETVPAFQAKDGALLFESGIIAEYFDANFGQKNALLTADPVIRSRVQVFMGNSGELIGQLYGFLTNNSEENRKNVVEHLKWIGDELAKSSSGPFYLGSTFSMADVNLVPFLIRFNTTLKAYSDFNLFEEAPWAKAMVEAALLRPSVAGTTCSPDFYVSSYSGYANRESKWPKSTLYYGKTCPFAQKARLAFAALGAESFVKLEELPLPLPKEYEKINPAGTVPALVTSTGELVQESNVIVRYLAEASEGGWGVVGGLENDFIPRNPVLDAQAKLFVNDVGGIVGDLFKFIKANGEAKEAAKEELRGDGKWLENIVKNSQQTAKSSGPWLLGEKLSYADVVALPWLLRIDAAMPNLGGGWDFFGEFPLLKALLDAGRADARLKTQIEEPAFYEARLREFLE